MRNHTAAHILAEAIRQVIGKPVETVGSGLGVDKARLDLALDTTLRPLFQRIEAAAEEIVSADRPVEVRIMNRGEAEKYVARLRARCHLTLHRCASLKFKVCMRVPAVGPM